MAARANPFFDILPAVAPTADASSTALSRLAQIHAEAVETARLANLLGRTPSAGIAIGVLAAITLAAAGGATRSEAFVWAGLVAAGLFALTFAYRHAIGRPFERPSLDAFAEDLKACLLYAGFAWGAGAFLALAGSTPGIAALLFAALPAVALAVLLRERQAVLLFLAPAAGLTSLACVLRPFTEGASAAAAALVAAAIAAVALQFVTRADEKHRGAELPHGFIAS